MFGIDGEDAGTFRKTLSFIRESRLGVIQITFATPLPGTELFQEMQNEERLTHTTFPRDWQDYRFSQVIFKPKEMSREDLYRGMVFVKDGLYSPASLAKRVLRTFLGTMSFTTAYLSYKFNKAYRRGYLETAYSKPYSSLRRRASRIRFF